jgi:hypothetical protein
VASLNVFLVQLDVPQFRCLVAGFPLRRPGFEPGSSDVTFMVNKVALGQVLCEYSGFPRKFSLHRLIYAYHHHHISTADGAGTIGKAATDVPTGIRLTPPKETEKRDLLLQSPLCAVSAGSWAALCTGCHRPVTVTAPSTLVSGVRRDTGGHMLCAVCTGCCATAWATPPQKQMRG